MDYEICGIWYTEEFRKKCDMPNKCLLVNMEHIIATLKNAYRKFLISQTFERCLFPLAQFIESIFARCLFIIFTVFYLLALTQGHGEL